MEERFDALTEALLEKEYWILDLLPRQLSAERAEAWFAAERFFLEGPRLPYFLYDLPEGEGTAGASLSGKLPRDYGN